MTEFTGRTALITGAGSGIGRAIALELARNGAVVGVNEVNVEAGRRVVEEIKSIGGNGLLCVGDVSSHAQVNEMVQGIIQARGEIHILVNNAGFGQYKSFESLTENDWDKMIAVHLKGAFNCIQAVLLSMKSSSWGRIINMASVAGMTGTPTHCHYSTAKAGLIGLTKALAREVAASGITVNAVAPGLTDTPFVQAVSHDLQQLVIERTPLKRMARAEEVAWVCGFLASDKAEFITGQVISPNGGFLI